MLYYQEFLSKFIRDNKELQAVQQYFSDNNLGPIQYIAESNNYLYNQFKSLGHSGITLTASGFYGAQGENLEQVTLLDGIMSLLQTTQTPRVIRCNLKWNAALSMD